MLKLPRKATKIFLLPIIPYLILLWQQIVFLFSTVQCLTQLFLFCDEFLSLLHIFLHRSTIWLIFIENDIFVACTPHSIYASSNSYASFVLSKLPACFISRWTHANVWTNCFITFSTRWKIFFSRDLFVDVMSVHNWNMKHARAIEFDSTNLLAMW